MISGLNSSVEKLNTCVPSIMPIINIRFIKKSLNRLNLAEAEGEGLDPVKRV